MKPYSISGCAATSTRHGSSRASVSPARHVLSSLQLRRYNIGDHAGRLGSACRALWSVDAVLHNLRNKRFEPKTVERVYEADVYPAVFDFASWHQHRSRSRYLEHGITLFRSYFFRDLLGPLGALVGAAVFVGAYESARQAGSLPAWLPGFSGGSSDTPFQLTSFALSLMLVFRTNSSYARWLDARQQWGLIVNTARTFARQALTTLPESSAPELRAAAARWTVAFVRLSKLHLREHGDVAQEMQGLLSDSEVALLASAPHRPLLACHVLSALLEAAAGAGTGTATGAAPASAAASTAKPIPSSNGGSGNGRSSSSNSSSNGVHTGGRIRPGSVAAAAAGRRAAVAAATNAVWVLGEQDRCRLEEDINDMSQALGACEKILRNPIPLSYTRHTSRFLILWLLWLPVALWAKVGWVVVPVEAVMTYLLLGIDEIAVQMEEPFGILPLENMCEAVQESVEQLTRLDPVVRDIVAPYYQHAGAATAAVLQDLEKQQQQEEEEVAAAAVEGVGSREDGQQPQWPVFGGFFSMPSDRC